MFSWTKIYPVLLWVQEHKDIEKRSVISLLWGRGLCFLSLDNGLYDDKEHQRKRQWGYYRGRNYCSDSWPYSYDCNEHKVLDFDTERHLCAQVLNWLEFQLKPNTYLTVFGKN